MKYFYFKEGPCVAILNIRGHEKEIEQQIEAGRLGFAEDIFSEELQSAIYG